jgi:hypothetical protein
MDRVNPLAQHLTRICDHASALRTRLMRSHGCQRWASVLVIWPSSEAREWDVGIEHHGVEEEPTIPGLAGHIFPEVVG